MLSNTHVHRRLPLILTIPLAIAVLCVAEPLAAQPPPPPDGSICWQCIGGCGGGWICDGIEQENRFGSNNCQTGGGPVPGRCHCYPSGGVCETESDDDSIGLAPDETKAMEEVALAVVAAGSMLPADGLFYYASRGDHLVLRRKCGDSIVGQVAVAELGNGSQVGRRSSSAGG